MIDRELLSQRLPKVSQQPADKKKEPAKGKVERLMTLAVISHRPKFLTLQDLHTGL